MIPFYLTLLFINLFLFIKTIPSFVLKKYPSQKINTINKTILYNSYYLSFTHATISFLLSCIYYPKLNILNANNNSTNTTILCFSLSYFLVDLWYSYFLRNYDFLVHHLCAIIPILSSLYLGNSANLIIIGIFFGEIINPIQTLAWLLNQHNIKISGVLFLVYNILYLLLRLIISPFIVHEIYKYLNYSWVSGIFLVNYICLYMVTIYWSNNIVNKSIKIIKNKFLINNKPLE